MSIDDKCERKMRIQTVVFNTQLCKSSKYFENSKNKSLTIDLSN